LESPTSTSSASYRSAISTITSHEWWWWVWLLDFVGHYMLRHVCFEPYEPKDPDEDGNWNNFSPMCADWLHYITVPRRMWDSSSWIGNWLHSLTSVMIASVKVHHLQLVMQSAFNSVNDINMQYFVSGYTMRIVPRYSGEIREQCNRCLFPDTAKHQRRTICRLCIGLWRAIPRSNFCFMTPVKRSIDFKLSAIKTSACRVLSLIGLEFTLPRYPSGHAANPSASLRLLPLIRVRTLPTLFLNSFRLHYFSSSRFTKFWLGFWLILNERCNYTTYEYSLF
jgi:hypothetical protein